MYTIKLKIDAESDLYNPYDESCRTLNADVVDYLTEQYTKKDTDDSIVLEIKCGEEVNYDRVKDAFQELIRKHEINNSHQRKLNRVKQQWLFCIGIVFVAAAIALNNVIGSVFVELISIVGSFAIWEVANIWIVENPKMRLQRHMIKKLKSTKIKIESAAHTVYGEAGAMEHP